MAAIPPTASQTVGPFFALGLPYGSGPDIVDSAVPGAITLSGAVRDGNADPVPDALLEVWHAGPAGSLRREPGALTHASSMTGGFRGFGRCPTDELGRYSFHTVKPGPAAAAADSAAPYIAMAVFARGLLRQLVTRVYFGDEADANLQDPLLAGLSADRRDTMIATPADDGYRFDVYLQGDHETVFLDVFAR